MRLAVRLRPSRRERLQRSPDLPDGFKGKGRDREGEGEKTGRKGIAEGGDMRRREGRGGEGRRD